jgi:hypothetical protein
MGLSYVKRARAVGVYSLTMSIFQLIAFPFGTASGILMIVARAKNDKETKQHVAKKKKGKHR